MDLYRKTIAIHTHMDRLWEGCFYSYRAPAELKAQTCLFHNSLPHPAQGVKAGKRWSSSRPPQSQAEAEAGKSLQEIQLENKEPEGPYSLRGGHALKAHLLPPAHFTKGETETRREEVTCLESQRDFGAESGLGLRGPVKPTAAFRWKSLIPSWQVYSFMLLRFWGSGLMA